MIGSRTDIWRQRVWVWATALGFLLLNVAGLLVYQLAYSDRVKTLDSELRDQGKQLATARAERLHREDLLRQARINRERIQQLYDEHFSTRRRRLTGVTAEVQDLAKRAGLVPRSFTFPEEQIQQYGLIKRSFVFSVEGTYADLRKFVNLLELSDSFLTLEDVSLSEEGGRRDARVPGSLQAVAPPPAAPAGSGALRMGLTIATLFAAQEQPRDGLAPPPAAAGSAAGAGAPPHGRTP
jgi:Tfp pilus assembly protein PilO